MFVENNAILGEVLARVQPQEEGSDSCTHLTRDDDPAIRRPDAAKAGKVQKSERKDTYADILQCTPETDASVIT